MYWQIPKKRRGREMKINKNTSKRRDSSLLLPPSLQLNDLDTNVFSQTFRNASFSRLRESERISEFLEFSINNCSTSVSEASEWNEICLPSTSQQKYTELFLVVFKTCITSENNFENQYLSLGREGLIESWCHLTSFELQIVQSAFAKVLE